MMDDRARFKMTAAIGESGDLAPLACGGIKPVAGTHIDLRLVVTMIASQCIHLAVEYHRTHMTTRVRQVRFALPVCAPFE